MEMENEIANAAFGFITRSAVALFLMLISVTKIEDLVYEIIFALIISFVVICAAKDYAELQVLKAKKNEKKND